MYSYSDTSIVSESQKTGGEVGLVLFFHAGAQCLISIGADITFGFGGGLGGVRCMYSTSEMHSHICTAH